MKYEEHMQQCREEIGPEHEAIYAEVNERLDQFAHHPDDNFLREHRKFLHHRQGIDYFRRRYGHIGGRAAELHVRSDCGHIPDAEDYYTGRVNWKGKR